MPTDGRGRKRIPDLFPVAAPLLWDGEERQRAAEMTFSGVLARKNRIRLPRPGMSGTATCVIIGDIGHGLTFATARH
jgi:hypothetical protein